MKTLQILFVPFFSILLYPSYGQDLQKKNEIGISISSFEKNTFTVNIGGYESKYRFGVYYNKHFSSLSWVSSVEYGSNVINDDCPTCNDGLYGKVEMTESGLTSGLRNTFFKQREIFIKPFIEGDLFYFKITYKGEFDGGLSGDGKSINYLHNTYGFAGRAGIVIQPLSRFSLTISSSMRIGYGNRVDRTDDLEKHLINRATSLLQIRLGYLF